MSVEEILRKYRRIAVVGLSKDPSKDSNRVASYMKQQGYGVVPVNPTAPEVLSEVCYPSLESMPDDVKCSVDIVQIFRPSKDVGPIVDEAIRMKKRFGCPRVIWTQLGIVDEDAACRAREAGIEVVMDRCMLVEHRRITAGRP